MIHASETARPPDCELNCQASRDKIRRISRADDQEGGISPEDSSMNQGASSHHGLEHHGLQDLQGAFWNYTTSALYEEALRRGEGLLSKDGALVVRTGHHTGRSANDKFVVEEPSSTHHVWWGKVNRPFDPQAFERIRRRMLDYLRNREVFVQDCFAGADPAYRVPVRIITEKAWHSIFARNMFIVPKPEEVGGHVPEFTVINVPSFEALPEKDETASETFILLNFAAKMVLIGGTAYAGETKKSVFTILNYLLPLSGVMPMHCSANIGAGGDTAIFFGLSGTGKTTLSADPDRKLIGDDEHGWSDRGVFNFEGGCYAKVIKLSAQAEPEIYQTTRTFGTILENVVIDPADRSIDLDDQKFTENTRGSYPITQIPNAELSGMGSHPRNIIMLTADAFGVMPPVARLTPEQAMYHFLSGYTAKVAGTERGVTEPQATFSACFGAPFMVHHPSVYGELLRKNIAEHKVDCWLVNTGWSGGPYGIGSRMKIAYTRAIIRAVLSGKLSSVSTEADPNFGVLVPTACPDVPGEILTPRNTWKDGAAYDRKARDLAGRFRKNFEEFAEHVSREVRDAGPKAA
jgi:phosphoenolpyruvate carboxykinase (ATP)